MTVYPCAKINLGLNVVAKRLDGYHDLQTVFYPVGLFDELSVVEASVGTNERSCTLDIEGLKVEGDPRKNLVVQAYDVLSEHYKLPSVSVKLVKRIPMQAGLGGGSADCAYMIRALNEKFGLGMSIQEMQAVAAKLGADCAFFINPVPSYAEGIGEKLRPVHVDLSRYKIVIVKPPVSISTKEAFANIEPKCPEECCLDIVNGPIDMWRTSLVNDFECGLIDSHSIICEIKAKLYNLGAIYAAMSGSGSALFGLFSETPQGLSELFPDCFTAVVNGDIDV